MIDPMKMRIAMKRSLAVFILLIGSLASSYGVTFTVTSTADNPTNPASGTLRWAIIQAVTSANAGNTVYIDFNAPGLVMPVDMMPVVNNSAGSITFQKSSAATIAQGVDLNSIEIANAFLTLKPTSSVNPAVKVDNLVFQNYFNYETAIRLDHSTKVEIVSCTFTNTSTATTANTLISYAIDASGNSSYYSTQVAFIHGCIFNGYRKNAPMKYVRLLAAQQVIIDGCTFDRSLYTGSLTEEMLAFQSEQTNSSFQVSSCTFIGEATRSSQAFSIYLSNPLTLFYRDNTVSNCSRGLDLRRHFVDISNSGVIEVNAFGNVFNNNSEAAIMCWGPKPYYVFTTNTFNDNNYDFYLLSSGSNNTSEINGLNLIAPNTLGYATQNSNNLFSSHNSTTPSIYVRDQGSNIKVECKFVGLNLKGPVHADGASVSCIIRENTIPIPYLSISPIDLFSGADAGNTSPTFGSAVVNSNGTLSLGCTVAGINTTNHPDYRIDFYRTDGSGSFLGYLGQSPVINWNAINGTHNITLPFNLSGPPLTGVGATVTSIPNAGSGPNIMHGTSEPGYIATVVYPPFEYNTPCTAIDLSCNVNDTIVFPDTTYLVNDDAVAYFVYNSYSPTPDCTPSITFSSQGKLRKIRVWYNPSNCDYVFTGTPDFVITLSGLSYTLTAANLPPGTIYIEVTWSPYSSSQGVDWYNLFTHVTDPACICLAEIPCQDCMGSFIPEVNKDYIISAWVREESAASTVTNFTLPFITLEFPGSTSASFPANYTSSGPVIDGWQKIYNRFTVPNDGHDIKIILNCTTGYCLFDDVRVFPADGMMKSYVYDPQTLRFVAELDEQNYASFYEYDEEGRLTTVKKETERGVMTIKESRTAIVKKQ